LLSIRVVERFYFAIVSIWYNNIYYYFFLLTSLMNNSYISMLIFVVVFHIFLKGRHANITMRTSYSCYLEKQWTRCLFFGFYWQMCINWLRLSRENTRGFIERSWILSMSEIRTVQIFMQKRAMQNLQLPQRL